MASMRATGTALVPTNSTPSNLSTTGAQSHSQSKAHTHTWAKIAMIRKPYAETMLKPQRHSTRELRTCDHRTAP